ncbi:MAG: hypothetical protein ACI4RA_07100 [Kiritimatiellia bacterium]
MTFTYTHRDATGALRAGSVEAADRAAALSALRGRGIVPLSVREAAPKPSPRALPWGRVAALALAAALAAALWRGLASSSEGDAPGDRSAAAQVLRTKAAKAARPDGRGGGAETPAAQTAPPVPAAAPTAAKADSSASEPPPPGAALPPPRALPSPTFETASDQVIAMALQDDGRGMAPLPMGAGMEREFLESLGREIVVLETDDAETRALKERVRAARAEIKALMDGGMGFAQIMREHRRIADENARIRDEATLEVKRMLDAGDVEGAAAYKRKIDLALGQMGIRGLSIAVTDEERAARAAARRARMLERRARQAARAPKDAEEEDAK